MLITYVVSVPPIGMFREETRKTVIEHSTDQLLGKILIILGLDIKQETEDCFSKFLLLKCFKMIKDIIKHHREVTIVKAKSLLDNSKDKWCSYSNININACKVCTHRQSLS